MPGIQMRAESFIRIRGRGGGGAADDGTAGGDGRGYAIYRSGYTIGETGGVQEEGGGGEEGDVMKKNKFLIIYTTFEIHD